MNILKTPNFDTFTKYQYIGYVGLSLIGLGLTIGGDGIWGVIGALCFLGGIVMLIGAIASRKPSKVIKGIVILLYFKTDKLNGYFLMQKKDGDSISLPEGQRNDKEKYWDTMYRIMETQLQFKPEKNDIVETDIFTDKIIPSTNPKEKEVYKQYKLFTIQVDPENIKPNNQMISNSWWVSADELQKKLTRQDHIEIFPDALKVII